MQEAPRKEKEQGEGRWVGLEDTMEGLDRARSKKQERLGEERPGCACSWPPSLDAGATRVVGPEL